MKQFNDTTSSEKGFYKLSWLQRIGFGSGDLAQNLIFQTTCMYLLFFYTDIYGLDAVDVSVMFTVGNVANVIWDPIVGALIDKNNPRLGKYRAYLVFVGIPLSGFAILCFWNGFAPSLLYAYVTYIAMTLLYTFINVPYGALNSSLTRDTNEITILTSVRMFMANCGGLAVGSGLPLLIAYFTDEKTDGLPKDPAAWFTTMTIYALVGLVLLLFCFSQCKEKVVMNAEESANVKISDLWMEFFHNRPLRVIAFFFITAFAMMSIGNAAGAYFINSNMHGTSEQLSIFMGLGSAPSFIFMPLVPMIKNAVGKKNMFYIFLSVAIIGMAILYVVAKMENPSMMYVYIAQFIKSTGVIVATGYMWALVPEVISYGEYVSGKRIAGIVNALTGIFFKAGMTLGSVVAPAILAYVAYDPKSVSQSPLAEEGILWLVCVLPAALLLLAMFIISKYELDDATIDKINKEIESRS
ncbi:MAG: glycoside-pentoside-hexuronide (GPH):cation symporter [Prevotellaceae bacterium]|nr:glycoside-pentoside-hexuronide (GPH):cation symporter [Prevotellaceae bacterium]